MSSYQTKDIFASNLARFLTVANQTQADLAKILGVSKSTVSSWSTGEKMPRMDKIEAMASHFGVQKSALLEPEGADDSTGALMEQCRFLSRESKEKLLELARHLASLENRSPSLAP